MTLPAEASPWQERANTQGEKQEPQNGGQPGISGRDQQTTRDTASIGRMLQAMLVTSTINLDGVLDEINQAALDGFGEFDEPNESRQLNPRAQRAPAIAPVLAFVPS